MSTLPAMTFDLVTRGAHLFNVTARTQDDRLRFTRSFDAAELLPVLIFSVGIPWIKLCVDSVCCLWDVATRYQDDDLIAAIGKTCNQQMNFTGVELMKGSAVTTGKETNIAQWDLTTRVHPNFVIMLFLCLSPVFYMYYEVVPIQWVERKSVTWSASWYGEPCHTMIYPDGREICIHCSNSKPAHSTYVFSADWFRTFECKWTCNSGYTGPNCEVDINVTLYACGGVFIVLCIAGVALFMTNRSRLIVLKSVKETPLVTKDTEEIVEQPPPIAAAVRSFPVRSEMISFKDNAVGEIRIKFL